MRGKTLLFITAVLLVFTTGLVTGCSKTPLDVLQQKVHENPDDPAAHNNLAYHLTELKRYQEALEEYNKSLELRPDDFLAKNNKGHVLYLMGRYEEAIVVFKELLVSYPKRGDVLANLAVCYHSLGELDEAKKFYEQALEQSPMHKPAREGYEQLKQDIAEQEAANIEVEE